ncbi:MAG: thioredoxin domain-containing protein [Bacteroidota bacterium]
MPNRLINASSPYLLQHAHNPVDWYPWGDEALKKAREENKLLLVSIGYAACHWCHVMEHESFENGGVAALMNEHFVCIKVDREERPDIDKIYMDAVMLMTGRGGWPLNAFALPDGRPIYGGTYFPREHWVSVLNQLAELHQNQPDRAVAYAVNLVEAMQQMDQPAMEIGRLPMLDDFAAIKEEWLDSMDLEWGGRKVAANKFPLPVNHLFMLRTGFLSGDADWLGAARISLDRIAFGGIYDHLGGGFARYSVDAQWKVPHFEKMLYDNGQLVSLYSEAYQIFQAPHYKQVVYDTLDFVERELRHPEGGFYASLDADSEGEEGKFYVWAYEEIQQLLGEEAQLFCDYYQVVPGGNWEGQNVLFVLETEAEFAEKWKQDPEAFSAQLAHNRATLFEARAKRIRPGLDDKVLCSWNALMIQGYIDAWQAFGEDRFLQVAVEAADFVASRMTENGRVWRNYKNGVRSIPGFLDDYAYLTAAFLAVYQATFDERWLREARTLVDHIQAHFSTPENPLFFYTSDEEPILVRRKTERQDDVIPASNSVLAQSLHALGLFWGNPAYLEQAKKMLSSMTAEWKKNPAWHANWGLLALKIAFPHYEVVITGPDPMQLRNEISSTYFPNRIWAGSESPSDIPLLENRHAEQPTIFICEGHTCQLPVHTTYEALQYMGLT